MSLSDVELERREQVLGQLHRLRDTAAERDDHWTLHVLDHLAIEANSDRAFGRLKEHIDEMLQYYELLDDSPRVSIESTPPQIYYEQLLNALTVLAPGRVSAYPKPQYRTGTRYYELQAELKTAIDAGAERVLAQDRVHHVTQARSELISLTEATVHACTLMPRLMHPALLAVSHEEPVSEAQEALVAHRHEAHPWNSRPELDYRFLYWRNHLILGIFNCPWAESEHSGSEV